MTQQTDTGGGRKISRKSRFHRWFWDVPVPERDETSEDGLHQIPGARAGEGSSQAPASGQGWRPRPLSSSSGASWPPDPLLSLIAFDLTNQNHRYLCLRRLQLRQRDGAQTTEDGLHQTPDAGVGKSKNSHQQNSHTHILSFCRSSISTATWHGDVELRLRTLLHSPSGKSRSGFRTGGWNTRKTTSCRTQRTCGGRRTPRGWRRSSSRRRPPRRRLPAIIKRRRQRTRGWEAGGWPLRRIFRPPRPIPLQPLSLTGFPNCPLAAWSRSPDSTDWQASSGGGRRGSRHQCDHSQWNHKRTESQKEKTSREEEKEGERVVGITAAVFSNVKNGATMSAREKTNCQNDWRRDCRSKPNQILTKLRDWRHRRCNV